MFIKKLLPRNLKILLKKMFFFGNKYYCNVCKSHLRLLNPSGVASDLFTKLEIIGGGYSEHDNCPVCLSGKRQQLLFTYLEKTGIFNRKNFSVLHIAPEEAFTHVFQSYPNIDYICGDIDTERYPFCRKIVYVDLTKIPFADARFDLIIASHVLEHIPDDAKALREIYRALKPGGEAILQVPISWKMKATFEDFSVTSKEERERVFGQKDHVRIYGADYIDRIKRAGFNVKLVDASELKSHFRNGKILVDDREKIIVGLK